MTTAEKRASELIERFKRRGDEYMHGYIAAMLESEAELMRELFHRGRNPDWRNAALRLKEAWWTRGGGSQP